MRRVRVKDIYREQQTFGLRIIIAAAVVVLALGLVAGRLFWLQVVRFDYYAGLSQGNRVRIEPLPPDRGLIFDREGRLLAENTPAHQLTITREEVHDLGATLARMVDLELLEQSDLERVRQVLRTRRAFEAVLGEAREMLVGDEEQVGFARGAGGKRRRRRRARARGGGAPRAGK